MRPSTRGGGSRFLYDPFDPKVDLEEREYRDVLRALGTPEQVQAKLIEIDELLEEKKRRDWLFRSIRRVAGWAAVVAGGWLAMKGLLTEFLSELQ
jgi:hypothetical protein